VCFCAICSAFKEASAAKQIMIEVLHRCVIHVLSFIRLFVRLNFDCPFCSENVQQMLTTAVLDVSAEVADQNK
jgi:hypothetical protein